MEFGGNVKSLLALGDVLSTVYCLENCGRQNEIYFNIRDPYHYTKHFKLDYVMRKGFENVDIDVGKICYKMEKDKYPLLGYTHYISNFPDYLSKIYHYNHHKSYPLHLKQTNDIEKKNFVIGQFDGKTVARHGIRYNNQYVRKIIYKHAKNDDFYLVGGPGTRKYLGPHYTYKIGNLSFIIKTMLESKLFLGIDSGLSHLAGCLGINNIIYIAHPKSHIYRQYQGKPLPKNNSTGLTCWDVSPDLKYYYNGYLNNVSYGRKDADLKIY